MAQRWKRLSLRRQNNRGGLGQGEAATPQITIESVSRACIRMLAARSLRSLTALNMRFHLYNPIIGP
jgi:hypothetical protein